VELVMRNAKISVTSSENANIHRLGLANMRGWWCRGGTSADEKWLPGICVRFRSRPIITAVPCGVGNSRTG
jgi:hypothetical protein